MADTVQYYLEQMVPELEDLEQKNIFTKTEIKSIIKRRTNFEYSIKRMRPQKIDFLRYIEYEMNLEQLRKKKKKRLGIRGKTTISDYSIPQRISRIFERSLLKFKGDVNLWLQYIEFARSSNSERLMSKIFGSALQLHPTKPSLWILAAKCEFENNANIGAARALMQRGLRFNSTSKKLWHEYFKLELVYIEKIKARRKVLGISSTEHDLVQEESESPNEENVIILPKITGEDPYINDNGNPPEKMKMEVLKTDRNEVLRGEIAKIVFRNATKAIPRNLSFRKKFIEIYREFSDTQDAQEEVYQSILKDFANDPDARGYLAERHVAYIVNIESPEFVSCLKKSIKEFEQCLRELTTYHIWYTYTIFLMKYIKAVNEPNLRTYFSKVLLKAYNTAEKCDRITGKMYLDWADFILSTQNESSENSLAQVQNILLRGTRNYPHDPELWAKRISAVDSLSGVDLDTTRASLYEDALKFNPTSEELLDSYSSWMLTSWKGGNLKDTDVDAMSMCSIIKVATLVPSLASEDQLTTIKIKNKITSRYLTWAFQIGGIKKAREIYERLLSQTLPDYGLYQVCIDLEHIEFASSTSPDTCRRIEWLYDQALLSPDVQRNHEVWLTYIEFLLRNKEFSQANDVYWKAMKILPDCQSFQTRYREILDSASR